MEALLEARPPVFSFVFGVPPAAGPGRVPAQGHPHLRRGHHARRAARPWTRPGVDLIVATGFEAGGHRPSFLARAEDSLMGTLALTPLVADRVKAPVIAAGGIADGRGIRAALTLGAQAAQLGTAFLACEESGATDAHRELLFSDRAKHTTLTRAFTGRLARGMRNRWTEEMASPQAALAPFPIQSWFLSKLKPAAVKAGRTDLVSLWAGQATPNLRHRAVPTLMESLVKELAAH